MWIFLKSIKYEVCFSNVLKKIKIFFARSLHKSLFYEKSKAQHHVDVKGHHGAQGSGQFCMYVSRLPALTCISAVYVVPWEKL